MPLLADNALAPRLGAMLRPVHRGPALAIGAGCLALALLFYSTLIFGGALHGYDWQSHHWNYFEWVRTSLRTYATLPLFMNDAWVTKNFLANAEAPILGPLVWLLAFVTTGTYVKLLVVLFTAAGLGGMLLLLWDLGVDPWAAAPAAALFAFGGFFVSHLSVGHPWALGGLALPAMALLYRRAALGSHGALLGAAVLNAFTIGGGQHQPFIWQNLLLGAFAIAWSIRVRVGFPLIRFGWLLLASLGFGAVKLLPMLAEFASYDPTARISGLPLGLALWTLYGRGQQPELGVDGLDGLEFGHGSGWWEYAFYCGPLGCAVVLAGLFAVRRTWGLLAIGAFFCVLAIEWQGAFGFLRWWDWLEGLPVWRTQRGPSRFLFPALFCLEVAAAIGIQRIADRWPPGFARLRPVVLAALALAVAADCFGQSLAWQRAALGTPLSEGDHRPMPLVLRGTSGASAVLVDFAPNRLVYHVRAPDGGRIVFPFRLGEGTREWRVDGLPVAAQGGKLALDLSPGERQVQMRYRPHHFYLGAAMSAATTVAFAAMGIYSAWRRRAQH